MVAPLIIAVLLAAAILVGGCYLVLDLSKGRDARWMLAISERVGDGDKDGAKAVAAKWERRSHRAMPIRRLRVAQGWVKAGDPRRALAILDGIQLPRGRTAGPFRQFVSKVRFDALEALGQKEQAQTVLDDAIKEDPAAPWLHMVAPTDPRLTLPRQHSLVASAKLIKEAIKDHRFEDAANMIESMLRRGPWKPKARAPFPHGYLLLATVQLAAGRDSAAEASFREFMNSSLDRRTAERRVTKARADGLLMGGRFSEAASIYQALAGEQGIPDAYAGLAMCRIRQGEPDLAASELDRAEELGYDADKAKFPRAQILADQGRSEEAVELAREAAAARPSSDREAVYTLAYVLATTRHPDADAALRTYVSLDPNDPDMGPLLDRPAPDGRTWREYLGTPRPSDI